jgi:hypothetical protein
MSKAKLSFCVIRGASKIKLKKVNKKRTVTVRRVIMFLNISRRPLLICLQCCLHQYKTLKARVTATAAIVLLTPAKNLKKVFLGFLVVSPLFNHFLHIDPSNNFCFCKFFAKGLKSEGERLKVEFWSSEMVKIGRGQQNYRRCRCRHRLQSFATMKKIV